LEIPLDGYRPIEEAIVTSGGVEVKEITPKTMESRLIPGLYFCGEVIDVDAYTGGYNLQIAFSTGYLAGKSAAES
jgi:predicted flavoprotein YhiN